MRRKQPLKWEWAPTAWCEFNLKKSVFLLTNDLLLNCYWDFCHITPQIIVLMKSLALHPQASSGIFNDHGSRSNGCHSMWRRTSARYHHVHLPNDLAQLDHSEAIHAVRLNMQIFFISLSRTKRNPHKTNHSRVLLIWQNTWFNAKHRDWS